MENRLYRVNALMESTCKIFLVIFFIAKYALCVLNTFFILYFFLNSYVKRLSLYTEVLTNEQFIKKIIHESDMVRCKRTTTIATTKFYYTFHFVITFHESL